MLTKTSTPTWPTVPIKIVENALDLAHERRREMPTFEILSSIITQLEYLLSVLKGAVDRARLKDIIVGLYAVWEFNETDPQFAQALMSAQNIATKMSKGLKP